MLKKTLIFFILLFLPAASWGATYYVATTGSDTSPYDTVEKAATSINTAIAAASSNGDIIYVVAGTYSENVDAKTANGVTITASGGTVNVVGNGSDHTWDMTKAYTINGPFVLSGSASTNKNMVVNGADTDAAVINDVTLKDGTLGLQVYASSATFNRLKVTNHTATYGMTVTGTADTKSPTFNYCWFEKYSATSMVLLSRGLLATFNNCLFTRASYNAVKQESSIAASVFNNCIFFANVNVGQDYHVITNGGSGTLTLNNCLILKNPFNTDYGLLNTTDGGGNLYVSPRFMSRVYPMLCALSIDDASNITFWTQIADVAEQYGMRVTIAVQTASVSAGNWTTLASYVARGHTVASHTRHHCDLSSLNAFKVTHAAGTTATVSYSSTTGLLTTAIDGTTDLSVDTANASYDTISEVVAYINAQSGYSATNIAAADSTEYAKNGLSSYLADVTDANIKTEYTALFDQTRYFAGEIAGSKTDIEAGIPGYTAKALVYPGNYQGATSRAAVKAAGFTIAGASTTSKTLSSLDVFQVARRQASSKYGFNTSDIAWNVASSFSGYGREGLVMVVFDHTSSNFSLANWTTAIQALSQGGVSSLGLDGIIADVVANGSTADSGTTYTRTLTDAANYYLQPNSPCIDTGKDVSKYTDYAGHDYRRFGKGSPPIGLYAFQNAAGAGY